MPDKNQFFTIENPLRIKRFLEVQLESAEALKITNDKINQLLSDETLETLTKTLKNTETLTARATVVMDSANRLFQMTSRDLEQLVATSNHLAQNISQVSDNLNEVIGNPAVKSELRNTVADIQVSAHEMRALLQDPALRQTLTMAKSTASNSDALVRTLKETAQDKELQQRLDHSLTSMNDSLDKLSVILGSVQNLTATQQKNVEGILQDTKETSQNLKAFSKKLNGRFALFRLIF
jgi:hypothetical protein